MADLSVNFCGIKSPNPFWLASAPPPDKAYNIERAFRAGWGGVVWKTLGEEGPPVVNVSGPRYGVVYGTDRRVTAFNNIELITDRPLEINLQEITEMKRRWLIGPSSSRSWYPARKKPGSGSFHGSRRREPMASSSTSAVRTACQSVAWVRPWARCRNMSRW